MFIDSFKSFFKNLKIIVPTLVLTLLFSIPLYFINKDSYYNEADIMGPDDLASYALGFLAGFLVIIIIAIVVSVIFQCWTTYMTSLVSKGESFTLFGSLKKSLKYFWRVLGVAAIQTAIAIAFIIIMLIIIGIFFVSISLSTSSSIALPATLGIILFLLGLFFYITLLPIVYVIINDDIGVGSGFSIGFKFGLKKFFYILGSLIPIIICNIIYVAVSYSTLNLEQTASMTILNIVFQIIISALGLIVGIYVLKLYNSSKEPLEEVLTIDETNNSNTEQ